MFAAVLKACVWNCSWKWELSLYCRTPKKVKNKYCYLLFENVIKIPLFVSISSLINLKKYIIFSITYVSKCC